MNKKKFNKYSIGIIGGAGPMAGITLMQNIIKVCQEKYFCRLDEDFPKVILISIPFSQMLKPDCNEQKEDLVTNELNESIEFLINNNVDKILISCNTLHYFLNKEKYNDKIINLISCTSDYIKEKFISNKEILLLATSVTSKSKLYNYKNIIKPEIKEQKIIDEIILKIMSGKYLSQEVEKM